MSLYRKYRPKTFADVVGQDHIVTTLENAAGQDKLAHAYLFAGGRGTGKTSVARILAKIMMIQGIEDETIEQQIIQGVEEGSIVDLLEIDAASNRGIDDIRDLVEKIQFSPVVAGAKVYIIDEAHMLTKEAFNALLKTLEEPPPYAHFILATTEFNKIPSTIQSRCQCFPFRSVPEEAIIRRLQFIADQEKINIEREALRAIAHHVNGGMRDAISLLDQMHALDKIALKDVQERIGVTGQEHIEAVFEAINTNDTPALIESVRKVEEAGVPLDVFLRQLLSIIRDSLHKAVENKESTSSLLSALDILLNAIRDIRIAPVPGLVVECALLSLCEQPEEGKKEKRSKLFSVEKKETSVDKETKRETTEEVHDVKEKPSEDKREAKDEKEETQEATSDETEDQKKGVTVEAPELSLESLKEVWPEILKGTEPASVKMSLKNGRIQELKDTKIILVFSSSFHRDKVAKAEASRLVEEIMERIFKKSLRLECVLEEEGPRGAKEENVNLAEAAAEIF